jgi:hypothetical protein
MSAVGQILRWIDRVMDHGLEYAANRYYGEYDCFVTDNADPLGLGRIMVMFPRSGSEAPIGWAWPDFRHGGDGYGEFWPPEVGDLVSVRFDNGEIASPVYTGGRFKMDAVPPEMAPTPGEAPKKRGWKTPAGHWLVFDDTADAEQATLASMQGSFLNLNEGVFLAADKGSCLLQMKDGKIVLVDESGNTLSSDGDGWTVQNGQAFIRLKGDTIYASAPKTVIAGQVSMGSPKADTPLMRFKEWFTLFTTHTHATVHGPSGPPLNAAQAQQVQTKSISGR